MTIEQLRRRVDALAPAARPAGLTAEQMTDDELATAILGYPARSSDLTDEELEAIVRESLAGTPERPDEPEDTRTARRLMARNDADREAKVAR